MVDLLAAIPGGGTLRQKIIEQEKSLCENAEKAPQKL
jgi:hypothetical protein